MNLRYLFFYVTTLLWLSSVQLQAAGTGLIGEYFTANNFTGTKSVRTDATVDFDWGAGAPGFGGLGTNNFSVRWSGQIEPLYDGPYTFYVTADDGAALWVNDRLIVSRLRSATNAQMGGQIALRAYERVNLRLEYIERPHRSLGLQTPAQFAQSQAREGSGSSRATPSLRRNLERRQGNENKQQPPNNLSSEVD